MMTTLPRHVAIIMDGNGRWATKRKMPRIAGHRAGAKVVKKIVEHSAKAGVEVLSLFAFSLENHNRPRTEVTYLMELFLESLEKNTAELDRNKVRLTVIGDRARMNSKLLRRVEEAESLTAHNTGLRLVIAINYTGRWDIVQACQRIALQAKLGTLDPLALTEQQFQQALSMGDLPLPDLFIRTSGEQRISNFMLWQFAYTELFFCPLYWPDFTTEAFDEALEYFATRERRFGLTSAQVSTEDNA